jgi:hypothetical protein
MKLKFRLLLSALGSLMVLTNATASTPQREFEKREEPRGFLRMELVNPTNVNAALPVPLPTPLALKKNDDAYRTAYKETYRVLSEKNVCSDFYGGSAGALIALNELAAAIRVKRLNNSRLGAAMGGRYATVTNMLHEYSYRRFEQAVINSDGAFYTSVNSLTGRGLAGIGSFHANTKGARVLMLLHELAHLVRSRDGEWLIPNDGDDQAKSQSNTALVEERCGQQIRERPVRQEVAKGVQPKAQQPPPQLAAIASTANAESLASDFKLQGENKSTEEVNLSGGQNE